MAPHDDTTVPATRRPRKSTSGSSPKKAMDKENATIDVISDLRGARKKSRSKSMGPGVSDVLKSGTGNRRVSLAAPSRPPPRSILKPTIPLLPEIPPHKPTQTGAKKSSPASTSGPENFSDNSSTKVALRTEQEQQAAAREREERERATLEKKVNDYKEARRKSLANRRVSFAAEATLHTFHDEFDLQDSTTSTDSTRRASSIAAQSPASTAQHHSEYDTSEPPSTPPEQVEEVVPESPANQRDLHQKKRRRSSGAQTLTASHPADNTMTSTVYDSDSDNGDEIDEDQGDVASNSDSDSDEGDGTLVTVVDADEMTSASVASARTISSSNSTDNLDEILRLASQRAGDQANDTRQNQPIEEDEEVIPAFGWIKKKTNGSASGQHAEPQDSPQGANADEDDDGMEMDMDTTQTGGIFPIAVTSPGRNNDEDMSMDVTQVLGGILSQAPLQKLQQTSGEDSFLSEATMDLTMAIGGIQPSAVTNRENAGNEDMSMELTTVLGGVLAGNQKKKPVRQNRRRTMQDHGDDELTMDMTVGMGRILNNREPAGTDDEGDVTMGMDITTALGGILNAPSPKIPRSAAKKLMEQEADQPESTSSLEIKSPKRRQDSVMPSAKTKKTESPDLSAFRGKGLRRSMDPKSSITTPAAQKASSSKEAVEVTQPATPIKSSPFRSPNRQSASPKRGPPSNGKPTTPRSAAKPLVVASKVFQKDPSTGAQTPRVVLTPQKRRLSGLGVDRTGLGSPKVAQIFDRRESLGDTATQFVPGKLGGPRHVAFEDPRSLEHDIDKERQDEEDKENRRTILEREADGSQDEREVTLNLKEMIQNLSPKKNLLKGRKSLHVGSAKGVLGKRPAELDDDDDAEERDGVKRLKGHQASPVKNVRLQQPPSKAETTGRMTRSRKTLENPLTDLITPTTTSPGKASNLITTPKGQGRFKNVDADGLTGTVNFTGAHAVDESAARQDADDDRIHLQDFLNMTSIRFMELTTTKRRHTVAPKSPRDTSLGGEADDVSLNKCVVAGACTVPMLELYQHSCRELKKYISEGRAIVREIETETFEENPPLFREYISASPDFKMLMDNQFKNVKTHARLLSKAMWYEWRMKLQEGLREGLVRNSEGMVRDDKLLHKQQQLLNSAVPALVKHFESLEREHGDLETVARELADCDPTDLEGARSELLSIDQSIEDKKKEIAELRAQLQDTESSIDTFKDKKQSCLNEIKEAEKIREDCRGWSSDEVASLKARVDALEQEHGWAITGVQGTTMSMTYLREIELVFDAASFQVGQQNSRIDLWYIGANREVNPKPCSPEKDFFLQCIREYVRGLPQAQTTLSLMLGAVRAGWDKALMVANQVRLLNLTFPTSVVKTSDNSIAIRSTVLLVPLQTKVEIVVSLHSQNSAEGVAVTVTPQASVSYGEQFNASKMADVLATRIGNRISPKDSKPMESWGDVLEELKGKLLARGRK